ncbi:MAG: clostripain-related cysteine peptidase [Thermomicrobiales bacterium]
MTEAYWATVEVAGTPKDVLSQCFERRCLTYTPDNDPGWQVEAGNVGLHYYDWRYNDGGGNNPPSPPADGLPVINEIKFWPENGGLQWAELYNPSNEPADLDGLQLTNGTLDHVSALPDVVLPEDAYLVVYFGEGESDLDFGDLRGAFYDADAPLEFLDPDHDEVGLYAAGEGVDTIVDFFYWTFGDPYQPQDAYADAVDAGIWTDGDLFDASRAHDLDFVHPVSQGETVGRDADSTDTNHSTDWAELGGEDALGETPRYRNLHQILPSDEEEPPPPPPPPGGNPKEWTILAFGDGRSNLQTYRAVMHELNKMEAAGSDENVNIVAQAAWSAGGSVSARRWYLNADANLSRLQSPSYELEPGDVADPGDPQALADFIAWAEEEYPAAKYAIVLIGHGQGWKGTMLAGENRDFLKMSELEMGLSALSQKFEVVEFESCMMGQAEVGYQIEPTAKMMIASEEVIWGILPWTAFLEELKDNPDWTAGEYADRKAEMNADAHRAARSAGARGFFTLASIDLAGLVNTLAPAVTNVATSLIDDVDDVNQHDVVSDNSQMTIKHAALEQAEYFSDTNFKDLYHFADLVSKQPLKAAAPAGPLKAALTEGGPVIRWEDHGPKNPNAHGLSIYFPHDLLLPDGRVDTDDDESAAGHFGGRFL